MALLDLENFGGESAEPIAGLATRAWYARWKDFATIIDTKKMEDDNPAKVAQNFSELSIITGNHIFKTTKCFKEIHFIQETGEIKSKAIGTKGGRLFENDVTLELAGSDADLLGFLRAIKNEKLIILIEEVGTGNIRQLGWSKYAATSDNLDHEIGATIEGKNSAKVSFKDKNYGPAPIYKGEISVNPAP